MNSVVGMCPVSGFSLVADVGATNIRFALADGACGLHAVRVCKWEQPYSLIEPARAYLAETGAQPRRAMFASAGAQPGLRQVPLVNLGPQGWSYDADAVQEALGLDTLDLVHDFVAIALSAPLLRAEEKLQIGNGAAVASAPIAVLGAGTGLGCSSLVWSGQDYIPVPGEGGHATLAAETAEEDAILAFLRGKYGHVSAERVLSGLGLENIHQAVCRLRGEPEGADIAAVIGGGLSGADTQCRHALDLFAGFLGSFAGNLALTVGARGGVYVGGGIVPRMLSFLQSSPFRARFIAKGRYRSYLDAIPTFVITHPEPGLLGAAIALQRSNQG